MSRKIIVLEAAFLMLAAIAPASNVDAKEPAPASRPWRWWDPLDLMRGPAAYKYPPMPLPRTEPGGVVIRGSYSERGVRNMHLSSRPCVDIPVDYSYDHIVDQP